MSFGQLTTYIRAFYTPMQRCQPTTAFYDFDAPPGSNSSEKQGQEAPGQEGTTLAGEPKPCACTKIYRPVCSGGKTYGNDCVAACAGVDIDCDGKCPCPGTTLAGQITKALQPVVGWEVSAAEIKPFGPNAVIAGELQIPVGNQSDNSLSNVAVPFLAFRGSSNLLNWISNFRSQNLTACGFGSVQGESPAAVAPKYCCARGFWETYKRWLQQFVLQWAAERAATSQAGAPVLITGHSLGGAFAVFAAADVLEAQPSLNVTVASYNAPRAGTQSLAQLVDTGAWRALRLQTFPELFSTLPFRANIFANDIPQCAGQIPTHTGVKFAINIHLSNTADPPTFPNWTVTPTEVCSTGSSADTQRPGFFDVTEYWRRAYNSSLAATADAAHGFFVTGNAVAAPQPVEAANPYLGLPLAVQVNASCAEALPQA